MKITRAIKRQLALCSVAALLLAAALPAYGDNPIAMVKVGDVTVVLHKEPCNLPEVTNLKSRATWTENGVMTEGCYGVMPHVDVVAFYFTDKTVAVIPVQLFEKTAGA